MQTRRMFLGSAAAIGVGTAAGGAIFFPAFDTHAQGHAPVDAVLAELQKQLVDTVRAIRKGQGKPGEHARRIAANIRLLNAHGVGAHADAELRRQLKEEGRDALLAREMDLDRLAAELKTFGVDRVPRLSATYADRARVFDLTVKNGMAAALAAVGSGFEQVAGALDRHAVTTVANRQTDEECWQWLVFIVGVEGLVWEWCTLGLSTCVLIVSFYVAWAHYMCSLGCGCIL